MGSRTTSASGRARSTPSARNCATSAAGAEPLKESGATTTRGAERTACRSSVWGLTLATLSTIAASRAPRRHGLRPEHRLRDHVPTQAHQHNQKTTNPHP
ncbi:hypothetical protein GCM10025864_27570 [Luteimicrobium album]|uniref:Uncharacterized protein n=1 Tax=Luteimicrobium album TaxID=1054550 RepID=A0ABQ6I4U4_9MICO|nr:hypothetical protein GCM10025864_27570 [Luteimicrobium album]